MSKRIWVKTDKGRTHGNWEYYAEADSRIKGIRDRYLEMKDGGPPRLDEKIAGAVAKITGFHRIEDDWKIANEGKVCSKEQERGVFEAWVEEQPPEHRRIYGHPDVITAFILEER